MPNWTPVAAALIAGTTAIIGGALFIGGLSGQVTSLDGRVNQWEGREAAARGVISFVRDEALEEIQSLKDTALAGILSVRGEARTEIQSLQDTALEGIRSVRGATREEIQSLKDTALEDIRSRQTSGLTELRSAARVAFPDMASLHEGPFSWRQGGPARQLLHSSEGICFLTRVTGKFEGGGEVVHVSISSEGYWTLGGRSAQSGVRGEARCWRFPPRPGVE